MDCKTTGMLGLRHRLADIIDYAATIGGAVRVEVRPGVFVWLVADLELCNFDNSAVDIVGSFDAPVLPADPVRKRVRGNTDIVGEEFRRLCVRLYGVDWYTAAARALGLSTAAVKSIAGRRTSCVPRRYSSVIKRLCAEAGIDWRVI